MSGGKAAYQEYLKSDHWRNLRRIVFERDGHKCSRCPFRVLLHVHHTIYRARFEDTQPEDLIILCKKCHLAEHGMGSKTRRKKLAKWKKRQLKFRQNRNVKRLKNLRIGNWSF